MEIDNYEIPEWIFNEHIFKYLCIDIDKLPILDDKILNKAIKYFIKLYHPDTKEIIKPCNEIKYLIINDKDVLKYKEKLNLDNKIGEFLLFIKKYLKNLNDPMFVSSIKNLGINFKLNDLKEYKSFNELKNDQQIYANKFFYVSNQQKINNNTEHDKVIDKPLTSDDFNDRIKNYDILSNIIDEDIKKDYNIFNKQLINVKYEIKHDVIFNDVFDNLDTNIGIFDIKKYEEPIAYNNDISSFNNNNINNLNDNIHFSEVFKIEKKDNKKSDYHNLDFESLLKLRDKELLSYK